MEVPFNVIKDILVPAIDAGNTSTKLSYITPEGNIESVSIPTVIAEGEKEPSAIRRSIRSTKKNADLKNIHLRIDSTTAFSGIDEAEGKNTHFVVIGETAKTMAGSKQPEQDTDKFKSYIHRVLLLGSLAIAAWRTGKGEKVTISLSSGLPISEMKKNFHTSLLKALVGSHKIEALGGVYAGKMLILEIRDDSEIQPEGITADFALQFDLQNGELKELDTLDNLGDTYLIADMGAGTLDGSLYVDGELDSRHSDSEFIGTNKYIDQMISEVLALKSVKKQHEEIGGGLPFATREQFVEEVIIPTMHDYIERTKEGEEAELTFTAEYGKDHPITEIVTKHMQDYVNEVIDFIQPLAIRHLGRGDKKVVIVGGGLLFGYQFLKEKEAELKERKIELIYPEPIFEAPNFTSRSYLLSHLVELLEREEVTE
jgi:plasmid segregation protein ParM